MKNTILISTAVLFGLLMWLNAADVVVYPRSTGYPYPCPVHKTGQKISYATRDDGWMGTNTGIAWPTTRFTVQSNTNCILDNLTGLIWAQNGAQGGTVNWGLAVTNCNNLNYGGQTDWRLPNWLEMGSLLDYSQSNPAIPAGHPFSNASGIHWTSTWRSAQDLGVGAQMYWGDFSFQNKTNLFAAWPVRGP